MRTIKLAADGDLSILAIPYGSKTDRDLDGEYFSRFTNLCLDWYPSGRPLLYDHGLDDELSVAVVGKVDATTLTETDEGRWVRAQLDRASRYYRRIRELIEQGALAASSGAYGHLVQKAADGEILRWPWVELSLTPTPANPRARVTPATAKAHYKAAGLAPPPSLDGRPTPRRDPDLVAAYRASQVAGWEAERLLWAHAVRHAAAAGATARRLLMEGSAR